MGYNINGAGEWDFYTAPSGTAGNAVTNTDRMVILNNGNVGVGTTSPAYLLDVASTMNASGYHTASDIRFKENIKPLENVLPKLKNIRGVSYDWNERFKKMGRATSGRQIGMIAQEVEKEFPELVGRWSSPDHPIRMERHGERHREEPVTWGYDYRSLDYNRFTAVLLEAIKEQQTEIEELQSEMRALKSTGNPKDR